MTDIWIRSAINPAIHLRMDASGTQNGGIGGKVNCQYYAADTQPHYVKTNEEVFELVSLSDGVFAIHSAGVPNVFLRMDGSAVTQFNGNGSGTVNCQLGMSGPTFQDTGVFQLVSIPNSPACALCLANHQNVFLRLDGSAMTGFSGSGGGVVNCQFYATGKQPLWTNGNNIYNEALYISGLN